ncbi:MULTISPECIES: hypothetical protein [unclassified Rhodococcus (in: high G+C Gram-positive bacteria)]|uniref:hypothetical protein n=1 Tax=unclassified Rhodococcus (in: high G+C Gram-positive bacteria) TaxID=192944 RepID=UPI0012DEA09F|nr:MULTISPECIES: hypothetical protein [unclassified Rhodococcus (in: high G+C Gram-positive bacteria)]MDQ1203417.1 LemA protein [Rhodococcus sp. SORGH_AS_0303]
MTVVALVAFVMIIGIGWIVSVVRRTRRSADSVAAGLNLLEIELDRRRAVIPDLVRAAVDADLDRAAVNQLVGARSLSAMMRDRRAELGARAGAENALSVALHEVLFDGRASGPLGWDFSSPATELDRIEHRVAGAVRVYNTQASSLASLADSPLSGPVVRLLGVRAPEAFAETADADTAWLRAPQHAA